MVLKGIKRGRESRNDCNKRKKINKEKGETETGLKKEDEELAPEAA